MDPQILKEFEEIQRADPVGELHAAKVVEYARDARTALHARFDWEDEVAGEKWRLEQARGLIAVYVKYIPRENPRQPFRAFVKINYSRNEGYKSTERVLHNPNQRNQLILHMLRQISGILMSYPVVELQSLLNQVNRLVKKFEDELSKAA